MKERILKWSRKEILRRGFRFTMSELARQLGVSTKTIYEFYPSKDELIGEILRKAIDELQVKEKEILTDPTLDILEKLQKLLILLPADFQFAHVSLLQELQRYYPEQWEILEQFINEQWEGIVLLINEGISMGKLRPINTKLFIELYIGGLYRLMEQSSRGEDHFTILHALQEMVDILMRGILKQES